MEDKAALELAKLQLEAEKIRYEIRKLEAEIPKLRRETSWRGTVVPMMVSGAAVLVSLIVGLGTMTLNSTSQKSQRDRDERQLELSCINSAASFAHLVFDYSKEFSALKEPRDKINYLNMITGSFPPSVAERFLLALTPQLRPEETFVTTQFQAALENVRAANAKHMRACPTTEAKVSSQEPLPVVASITRTSNTSAPASPAPIPGRIPPVSPVPPAEAPIVVLKTYYHITREADRSYARELAESVASAAAPGSGASFPKAGIELVPLARPLQDLQVRYYHPEQETLARQLLDLLLADARRRQLAVTGRVVYLGESFPNLPLGRIEVWFPPLASARSH